ncbi:MAG: hypothetical protein EBR30_25220 [Cytophagia bacterium]|nr:hypothetical protein [Cytophagia bacterium]
MSAWLLPDLENADGLDRVGVAARRCRRGRAPADPHPRWSDRRRGPEARRRLAAGPLLRRAHQLWRQKQVEHTERVAAASGLRRRRRGVAQRSDRRVARRGERSVDVERGAALRALRALHDHAHLARHQPRGRRLNARHRKRERAKRLRGAIAVPRDQGVHVDNADDLGLVDHARPRALPVDLAGAERVRHEADVTLAQVREVAVDDVRAAGVKRIAVGEVARRRRRVLDVARDDSLSDGHLVS